MMHGFLQVVTWICQSCYMDLLKLLHGFVKVVLFISQPLPSKTKLKFDQDFKACEASVVYYWTSQSTQCLWSVVPLAMFFLHLSKCNVQMCKEDGFAEGRRGLPLCHGAFHTASERPAAAEAAQCDRLWKKSLYLHVYFFLLFWIFLWFLLLSDPSPIIGYACQ